MDTQDQPLGQDDGLSTVAHLAATAGPTRHAQLQALHLTVPHLRCLSRQIYPYQRLGTLKNRWRFLRAALKSRDLLRLLLPRPEHLLLRQELQTDPKLLGFIEWPLIHAGWTLSKRLEVLSEHLRAVAGDMAPLQIGLDDSIVVADLQHVSPGLRLVVDRAPWHMREGSLVFSQFQHEVRLMTMGFSFGLRNGERVAYVGSIQGSKWGAATYKDLGKDLHGLRSRDFLVKAFQYLMQHLGVRHVLCVSEVNRHHRHPYFSNDPLKKFHMDYDQVWREHHGEATEDGFFQLPMPPVHRALDTIAAKNRALYRRRHAMLDELSSQLQRNVDDARLGIRTIEPRALSLNTIYDNNGHRHMGLLKAIKGGGLKTRMLHPIDEWWDRKFGVHTVGFLPEVGDPSNPDWRAGYVPAKYQRIVAALRHLQITEQDTFLDLGCGLGRAVFAASWLGAHRAVGVEIDRGLVAQAEAEHQVSHLSEHDIRFVCASADHYPLDDSTVIFMFNPFGQGTMTSVIANLERSLRQHPRRVRIAYENPLQAAVLDACPLLKRTQSWPAQRWASPHPITFWESTTA